MLRREREGDAERALAVADIAHRVAVLLQSGVAPERAWQYLADVDDPLARVIDGRLRAGMSVADALGAEGAEWEPVAGAWRIATEVGAPLADTLRSIAAAVRDGAETADDIRVALAEPAMTARLMLWLPVFGLLLGALLGFDTLTVLVTTPIGLACLVLGVGLILLARWWTRRLVRRALDGERSPGLRAELTAIALSGGTSIPRAVALVDDAESGADLGDDGSVRRVLELSRVAGIPAAELLRSAASDDRRRARTSARMRAAQLGTRLLLPLGICTLPAFFLLGVAPLVLSVITSTAVTW